MNYTNNTSNMSTIRIGSDFSGVGAFDQALKRLAVDYTTVFACDMDKYARQTFEHNYGKPVYYPENVYNREIPIDSLDIYMTSPPCQAFSLAGKRGGESDKRGILFYNSHEFIMHNKPRFFIFENVKGLLSDDQGRTFNKWVEALGGKSVNGTQTMFVNENAAPYHIYYQVLNAKNYGIPQNRERVFIIGIRDDKDNEFSFPRKERLDKRLKDVLENEVDEKYFLSEGMVQKILGWKSIQNPLHNIFDENSIMSFVLARGDRETHAGMKLLKVKSATSQGYETATENDSINFSVPSSETRRGRVGKGVAQTLDTSCNQGVIQLNQSKESGGKQPYQQNRLYDSIGLCPALNAGQQTWGGNIITLQNEYKIRRLTPRECFRLMDFPDTFDFSVVSDSQAYKQAGNSICVGVLERIIKRLKL